LGPPACVDAPNTSRGIEIECVQSLVVPSVEGPNGDFTCLEMRGDASGDLFGLTFSRREQDQRSKHVVLTWSEAGVCAGIDRLMEP
jgi:hypothetical protein